MYNTPILFLIFNRPDTTKAVFEEIRKIKPRQLFVAADGPRTEKNGEVEKCWECQQMVLKGIDWDCELKTLFREKNMGCGPAVSDAITWFFDNVEQGIILEDDCLPHQSFFSYCEELLDYYKNNDKIFSILGTNFLDGRKVGDGSYYFSFQFSPVGWASWRRAWQKYDYGMKNWQDFKLKRQVRMIDKRSAFEKYWYPILDNLAGLEKKYTWDYQWMFTVWYNKAINIMPNTNLVSNLGYRDDATHTKEEDSPFANLPTYNIGKLIHPLQVIVDNNIERLYIKRRYYIQNRWEIYKEKLLNFFNRN